MAAKKKRANKSEFIRNLPSTLSVSEVIAKGKAAGLKFTESYVYKIRRSAKKGAAKKTTKSATPKKASASKKQSKADFVRAHPDLAAKEVVEAAKAAGIKMSVASVYNARAYSKKAKKSARRARTERNGAPVARPISNSSKAEALLKALGAELGLARAIEILEAERASVRAALGG